MTFINLTELATGEAVSINPNLVFAVKRVADESGAAWSNLLIVGERYPQNVVSVQEPYEDVLLLLNGHLM